VRWIIVFLVLAAPSLATAEPLELVCMGEAIKGQTQESFGTFHGSNGAWANGSVMSVRRHRTEERLRLKIDDTAGTAQIKLPPNLVPPLNAGGHDSWWEVSDLQVSEASIRGAFKLNLINHGSFVIDRHTGDIDARALGMRFAGACEKAVEAPDTRKF